MPLTFFLRPGCFPWCGAISSGIRGGSSDRRECHSQRIQRMCDGAALLRVERRHPGGKAPQRGGASVILDAFALR